MARFLIHYDSFLAMAAPGAAFTVVNPMGITAPMASGINRRLQSIRPAVGLAAVLVMCSLLPADARRFHIERIGTQQGLSQSHIFEVLQDSRGFMWFATRDGLNLYDGYRFTVFRHIPFDSSSPSNSSINCIGEAADGSIWLGVGNVGLNRMDRATRTFRRYRSDPADSRTLHCDEVSCILGDNRGYLWVGTNSGLSRYHAAGDDFTRFTLQAADTSYVENNTIVKLYEDRRRNLWVVTRAGTLCRFNPHTDDFESFGLISGGLSIYGEDTSGALYLGYLDNVFKPGAPFLFRFTPADNRLSIVPDLWETLAISEAANYRIMLLGIEPDNSLWLCIERTDGKAEANGLYRVAEINESATTILTGLPPLDAGVTSFHRSREGLVWIGGPRGLLKLSPDNNQFITHRNSSDSNSLSNDFIRSAHVDPRGVLWIGTQSGLNRWNDSSRIWERFYRAPTHDHFYRHNIINDIYNDDDGTLLLATNRGLHQLDYSTRELVYAPFTFDIVPEAKFTGLWSMNRGPDGYMWVGTTRHGLLLFDRDNRCVREIRAGNPAYGEYTGGLNWCMLRDSYGTLWVGTTEGLNRHIPGTRMFKAYTADPLSPGSLSGSNICALFEDRDTVLWAIAHGGGINRYDRAHDSFIPLTSRNGLPDDAVYGMLQDKSGAYWLSGNRGLTRYSRPENNFRTYTLQDGLQGNEFAFRAFAAAPDGRLYFGGINGLNEFQPENLQDNRHLPPIVITAFNVFDTLWHSDIYSGDTLEIDYDQNFISFEFAALDYANPSQNRYAYKLEGFNQHWVQCGGRHHAEFTNLDPGDYVFRVVGSNNDGLWNNEGSFVLLRVVPPFWKTGWFLAVSVGGGILVLSLVIVLRVRSVLGRNLLKRHLLEYRLQSLRLQMNPHFIFNSLSSIEFLILQKEEHLAAEYLSRFARLVRGILENARSASVSIEEELTNLKLYLELESLRFEHAFAYHITVDPTLDIQQEYIPSMVIQPYVENAVRHGMIHTIAGGRLLVELHRSGSLLHCLIEDNGIGRARARELRRAKHYKRKGLGMQVSRERLELLNSTRSKHITCTVSDLYSETGCPSGTRIELWIPLETHKVHTGEHQS